MSKRRMKGTRLRPVPTTLFSFKRNTFMAEASDLIQSRHYFGSCLTLLNPATHNEVEFDLRTVERDREGETTGWVFVSVDKKHPDLKVHIVNE